jgi:hypothetical protein
MADQFETYLQLLELAKVNKTKAALREAITKAGIQILETEPFSGYFRSAAVKDGPLLPVAIWREGDVLHVWRAGEQVKLERVWPYCCWNPIPYDWYEAATERGEPWPDQHVDAPEPEQTPEPVEASVEVIDKPTTEEKPAEAAKRAIEKALAGVEQYAKTATDDQAAAAQELRSKLNELSNKADKKRKALMQPYKEKMDEIHDEWMPLVKMAKGGADTIRSYLGAYETKKFREQQEAERAAQEAAAAQAKAEAPTANGTVPTTHNEPPADPSPAAPTPTAIKGASGRAATVKAVKVAKVTDYDALYAHVKAFPEIKTTLDRIAQRLVDGGQNPPGVEIEEQRKVA